MVGRHKSQTQEGSSLKIERFGCQGCRSGAKEESPGDQLDQEVEARSVGSVGHTEAGHQGSQAEHHLQLVQVWSLIDQEDVDVEGNYSYKET